MEYTQMGRQFYQDLDKDLVYIILFIFFCYLSYFTYWKSTIPTIQVWAQYLYSIDYQEFFILKRSFIGFLFKNFYLKKTLDVIYGIYVTLLLLFILINSFILSYLVLALPNKIILLLLSIYFTTSSFYATLAYNIGYPDLYIFIISLIVFFLLTNKKYIIATFFSIIGILIHEIFIFEFFSIFFLSLILLRKDSSKIVLIFVILIILSIIISVYSKNVNIEQILKEHNYFNFTKDYITIISKVQYGQTIFSAIKIMTIKFKKYWINFVFNLFYFLYIPLVFFLITYKKEKTYFLSLFATFGFLFVFLFAWDLSRFLQYIIFNFSITSFILITQKKKYLPARKQIILTIVLIIGIIINIFTPLVYTYFEDYDFVLTDHSQQNIIKENFITKFISQSFFYIYYKNHLRYEVINLPIGRAGKKMKSYVMISKNKTDDVVLYGPYKKLPSGKYMLKIFYNCSNNYHNPFKIEIVNQKFRKIHVNKIINNQKYLTIYFNVKNNLDRFEFLIKRRNNKNNKLAICKIYYYDLYKIK